MINSSTMFCAALALLVGAGCDSPTNAQYTASVAFPDLRFTRPVDLQNAGDGTDRLFVVEQAGVIRVFPNDGATSSSTVFLDIRDRVDDSGNEEGLLGLAFHPDYSDNGYFYVNYTASGPDRTVISRFEVTASDPDVADADSETPLLTIGQPFGNHNGGQVAFGQDGMLYIAVGDGGSGGDPMGHGQNRTTLLGNILRIDVDNPSGNRAYGIPVDNPFAANAQGFREEIFAYGLRNPWRMSFDSETGDLWTGDVGQNRFEEIDVVESGENYGWNIAEGFECFGTASCDMNGLAPPVHAYPHESGDVSVTGGYVYRGTQLPEIHGTYVYADFGSGRIWHLIPEGEGYQNSLLVDTGVNISSFGVDESQELYICAFDGRIYRLEDTAGTSTESPEDRLGKTVIRSFPNPFEDVATVSFGLSRPGPVLVTIYDALGRSVVTLVDRYVEAGDHTVTWSGLSEDLSPVSAGVYYVSVLHNATVTARPILYAPTD